MANNFEQKVKDELYKFLRQHEEIDEQLPVAIDIEELWPKIGESYLIDGVREFQQYPTVSLGWTMYIGMGLAKMWDDDWEIYSKVDDLYLFMRDKSGYDLMDEYIRGPLLGLKGPDFDSTEQLVQGCAELAHTMLMHEGFEPSTEDAFRGYVACIHQLYLMGAYVQLHRMGYHMSPMF